jgi:DNA-binding response OmpR family regulator
VHRQGYRFVAPVTMSPQAPAAPGDSAAVESTVPPRAKILIVDDEPFNVDLLEQELADLGYETISARDGQEALDKVAAAVPDLILLDVMMPIMDGFTVCRRLKDHDETRLIPIVIMTALGAVEDRIKGIEAGADDFLTKPVHPKELFARVHTALKLKHTMDRKLAELRQIKGHIVNLVQFVAKPEG